MTAPVVYGLLASVFSVLGGVVFGVLCEEHARKKMGIIALTALLVLLPVLLIIGLLFAYLAVGGVL